MATIFLRHQFVFLFLICCGIYFLITWRIMLKSKSIKIEVLGISGINVDVNKDFESMRENRPLQNRNEDFPSHRESDTKLLKSNLNDLHSTPVTHMLNKLSQKAAGLSHDVMKFVRMEKTTTDDTKLHHTSFTNMDSKHNLFDNLPKEFPTTRASARLQEHALNESKQTNSNYSKIRQPILNFDLGGNPGSTFIQKHKDMEKVTPPIQTRITNSAKIQTPSLHVNVSGNARLKSIEKHRNMGKGTSKIQQHFDKSDKSSTPALYPDLNGDPVLGSKQKNRNINKVSNTMPQKNLITAINSGLVLNTSGCKISKFDPWDPTVMEFIKLLHPFRCSEFPNFLAAEPHGIIHLNIGVLKKYYNSTLDDIDCWYQGIKRKHEEPGNIRENDYYRTDVRKLKFNLPIEEEYVVVRCFFNNNHTHEQYFPLVKLKEDAQKEIPKTNRPLNVILLGIDSVSSLNFVRHFKKTKAFLTNKMNTFKMNGYTKVGDNTFPNLVPLLTGHFVEHLWNETIKDTFYFDNVSFIWKEYSRYGYKTFLAEDMPYSGTFNYLKKGFHDPPTDYYYRPMALAIENSEAWQKAKADMSPCINSQLEVDIMYDYLNNFVKTMNKRRFFAFCMVSILTHDDINYASWADEPAERILRELDDAGAFETSIIVIFSDHGIRYGDIRQTYIGKYEERMPFMHIHVPRWFRSLYPNMERNLKINQNRLITLFDLHATMKHLLHLEDNFAENTDELGLSLLDEIPENRTCADANIKPHYCPCNNYVDVSVNDSTVKTLSQLLVDHLNDLLLPHSEVCAKLKVYTINDARLDIFSGNSGNEHKRKPSLSSTVKNYLITLSVKPSSAIFEATIQYDIETNQTTVLGISRLNMYGRQSWCIDSQVLRLYCYCKAEPP